MNDTEVTTARYTNPIRFHDVPDPDAIRLSSGGYALVASSFDRRPGLPLWWSDDLVQWQPVGFAGGWRPLLHPSGGVWAPSIREHDGRLYITWADPDRGVFVVDAPGLEGPWSEPRALITGPGAIDPCPLWDDDGRAWLIHGWARSRAGFANRLDIVEVDAGLRRTVSESRVAVDGDAIVGCTVLEGPKLYRRGDHYWIFAPAGGVESGWQYAFRSSDLNGPWEHRLVLEQGASAVNGPHQGAWVSGADGEEWFLHFQHTALHGRILHLQPLVWSADGWPRIGAAVDGGRDEPVAQWRHPTRLPVESPSVRALGAPTGWHGRGADPVDLVESHDAHSVRLRKAGALAQPLDARTLRIEATLREGAGALSMFGLASHSLRVVPHDSPAPAVRDGETLAQAALPCRLGIEIDGDSAQFVVDGIATGQPFALVPPQWTGMEFGLSATGDESAFFEDVHVELG